MNVLVFGGRSFSDRVNLFEVLDGLAYRLGISRIFYDSVSGRVSMACAWADARNVRIESFDLANAGTSTGDSVRKNRNQRADKPDLVVALSGGDDTANMVQKAKNVGLTVIEVDGSP